MAVPTSLAGVAVPPATTLVPGGPSVPVAARAETGADQLVREVEAGWGQEERTLPSGRVVDATVRLSASYPEGTHTDDTQAPGTRTFSWSAPEGAFVLEAPGFCLDPAVEPSSATSLSADRRTLSCTTRVDEDFGTAQSLSIPVRLYGPTGTTVTPTVTDVDAGTSVQAPTLTLTAQDGMNVAVSQMESRWNRSVASVSVWVPEGMAPPEGKVTFDLVLGSNNDSVRRLLSDGEVSFQDPANGPDAGFFGGPNVFATAGGATWSAQRDSADPLRLHVTVTGLSPQYQVTRFADKRDAGGAVALSGALLYVDAPSGFYGAPSGTMTQVSVQDVTYTSAWTHKTYRTTGEGTGVANTVGGDDDLDRYTIVYGAGHDMHIGFTPGDTCNADEDGNNVADCAEADRHSYLSRIWLTGSWETDPRKYNTYADPWSAGSRVMPGGTVTLSHDLVSAGGVGHTWTLFSAVPCGQGAWPYALETHRDQVLGGTVEYYTGDGFRLSMTAERTRAIVAGDAGWSATPPSDMSQVCALRVRDFTLGRDTLSARIAVKVSDTLKAGSWVQAYGGALDRTSGDTTWFYSPAGTGSITDPKASNALGALVPTNPTTVAFKVAAVRAANTWRIADTDAAAQAGRPVPVSGTVHAMTATSASGDVTGSTLTITLPRGVSYVDTSATGVIAGITPTVSTTSSGTTVEFTGLTLTLNTKTDYGIKVTGSAPGARTLTSTLTLPEKATESEQMRTATAEASFTIVRSDQTTLTKTADADQIALTDSAGTSRWTLTTTNHSPTTQDVMDLIDILPWKGDKRGNTFTGKATLTALTPAAGTEAWVTAADPATLSPDPAAASNSTGGRIGQPTATWRRCDKRVSLDGVTAVRFIARNVGPTVTLTHHLDYKVQGMTTGQKLVNSAVERATTTGLRMIESADTITAGTPSTVQIDKTLAMSPDQVTLAAGRTLTWDVTVQADKGGNGKKNVIVNDVGGKGLTGVRLTNLSQGTANGGTWNVGDLPAGAKATAKATATITPDYDGTDITNRVYVGDPGNPPTTCQPNPDVTSDTDACDEDTGKENTYLRVNKDATPEDQPLVPGQKVTFKVAVSNDRGEKATTAADVTVTDLGGPHLENLTFGTVSAGTTDGATWTVGDLAPGTRAVATVSATIADDYPGGDLANTVIVSNPAHPRTPDSAVHCEANVAGLASDTDQCDIATLTEESALHIDKERVGTGPVSGSERLTYRVRVSNDGPDTAAAVTVRDLGGQGLTQVRVEKVSVGSVQQDGTWLVGDLPAGHAQEATITALAQASSDADQLTNTARVSNPFHPGDPDRCEPNDSLESDDDQCDLVNVPVKAAPPLPATGASAAAALVLALGLTAAGSALLARRRVGGRHGATA